MSPSPLGVFQRNAVDLVAPEELEARLRRGRPLRIKFGCDPSAPDLHLGHMVVLSKLRELQDLGHTIIFLVGDFTAMIGDPTGRSRTRPALSREEIQRNARTYTEQVGLVLDASRIETRFNSEWMDALRAADLVRLLSHQTVARMLERDDFRKRYTAGTPIALHELLYPLVQAYDSVALRADLEIGGTDQLFNLLLGREIQRAHGQEPQIVLTQPLLEGTDGVEKMSKSLGNAVGIREPPDQIYGKVMSISDALLPRWVRLLAAPAAGLEGGAAEVERGEGDPRGLKAALARHLVGRFHGEAAAAAAEARFDQVHRRREVPEDLPLVRMSAGDPAGVDVVDAVLAAGFASSRSEARRLLRQGGVRLDGAPVAEVDARVASGAHLLQVGKRRFARLEVAGGSGPG